MESKLTAVIPKEVHTRCGFASSEFNRYAKLLSDKVNSNGSIIGNNPQLWLRKLNQANRIWQYYASVFNNIVRSLALTQCPNCKTWHQRKNGKCPKKCV